MRSINDVTYDDEVSYNRSIELEEYAAKRRVGKTNYAPVNQYDNRTNMNKDIYKNNSDVIDEVVFDNF